MLNDTERSHCLQKCMTPFVARHRRTSPYMIAILDNSHAAWTRALSFVQLIQPWVCQKNIVHLPWASQLIDDAVASDQLYFVCMKRRSGGHCMLCGGPLQMSLWYYRWGNESARVFSASSWVSGGRIHVEWESYAKIKDDTMYHMNSVHKVLQQPQLGGMEL